MDLVILQEEKRQNDGRNTVVIIALPPSFLLSQPHSPQPIPKPLESEIPAKHLDYEPKALDPPDLTEPEPNA
jgi:hypothetical protein